MKFCPPRNKSLWSMLLSILLLFSIFISTSAQSDMLTGSGTISGEPLPFSPTLTLSFPPKGGAVNGTVSGSQPFYNGAETCTESFSGTVTGTFAGGDNGAASGSMNMTYQVVCSVGTNTQIYGGTWQGTLGAGGAGSGTWSSAYGGGAWQITYSASDFQSIIAPRVYDYLYFWDTYGVNLQDGDKTWEQKDMKLLDEVLSNLPEEFLDKLRVKVFRRYEADWDENWNTTETFGLNYPNANRERGGELMMFDNAYYGKFYGDESGETAFKAVLVHEMMHSLQESVGTGTVPNQYANPLVKNFYTGNCWKWDAQKLSWKRGASCIEELPWRAGEEKPGYLPYSSLNPLEDMSVSAESYVYSPDLLKSKNPARYEYMKNNVFGGVEYENGIPK